jgi:hypothetical protein
MLMSTPQWNWKSAEQILPEVRGKREEGGGRGRGRNDPNNACTCE